MSELGNMVQRGLGPGTYRSREFNPWEEFDETESGLLVPSHVLKKKRWPTAVDLFSGIGGFSLGFMRAGFKVVGCLDNDPQCMLVYLINLGSPDTKIFFIDGTDEEAWECLIAKTLKADQKAATRNKDPDTQCFYDWHVENLKYRRWGYWHRHYSNYPDSQAVEVAVLGDARKITGEQFLELLGMELGELDCICGGPPCQGFSQAGKRQVMDLRNSLVFEWARLVVEMLPKTCVMENVPGILTMVTPEGLPVIDVLARILEDGGMGPQDALRKMLLQTSGAGAVISSKGSPVRLSKKEKKALKRQRTRDKLKEAQQTLF